MLLSLLFNVLKSVFIAVNEENPKPFQIRGHQMFVIYVSGFMAFPEISLYLVQNFLMIWLGCGERADDKRSNIDCSLCCVVQTSSGKNDLQHCALQILANCYSGVKSTKVSHECVYHCQI